MEEKFKNIKFKYLFRDYQQETLEMLDKYKNDKKLHIVAAPGAGKTILALELMLRIGNKTLILTPTIAIKEQWMERLRKDFENGDEEGLISDDLENPSIVTVDTYQSLYSLKRRGRNIEKILEENYIRTIILDEAHHLRRTWFKVLNDINEKLENCVTISLTATPPYDNGNEFANYMSLCGEIDAKITIPQLVKSGCLCEHQDYIYFNIPTEEEEKKLEECDYNINRLVSELKENTDFIKTIALHDYIVNANDNIDNILEEFDFYVAIVSFLKEVKCYVPRNEFNKNISVPKFNNNMMGIILERYIFGKEILEKSFFEDMFKIVKERLNVLGCIDEKKVNLKYTKNTKKILLKNSGKLDSIKNIIKIEQDNLKEELKLVVVTDFIKEEYYDIADEEQITEIGVLPIFRKIISDNEIKRVSIITGSLIVIPTDLRSKLIELAEQEYNIKEEDIEISELGMNFDFSKVIFKEKHKKYAVNLITKLFHDSDISVLIGTIALIGEGWDAPFINSLIMASFVSSYVTSNQVRGRAIRIDKSNVNKVSNIWHLVCLERKNNCYELGQDYEMLSKRFMTYEGVNLITQEIDSGIERLNIEDKKYTKDEIVELNKEIINNAVQREQVTKTWKKSLENYKPIFKEKIPIAKLYKNKVGRVNSKKNILLLFLEMCLDCSILYMCLNNIISYKFMLLVILNRLIFNKLTKSRNFFIKRICMATYLSMKSLKKLNDKAKYYLYFNSENLEFGLENADTYEQMLFIKLVKQAMNLDTNSRYIIKSGNKIYSVPELFNKNRKEAEIFKKNLKLSLRAKLIYTRSEEGKKILLKYKMKEFEI